MKCEECEILIEEYADGVLDQKSAGPVREHLASCASCSAFHQEWSREQEIYSRYQRDVAITPLLWSSIEARIKQERAGARDGMLARLRIQLGGLFAGPRFSPAFAAALVVVAIALTVVVMTLLSSTNQREQLAGGNRNVPAPGPSADDGNPSTKPPTPDARPKQPEPGSTVASSGGGETAPKKTPAAKLVAARPTPDQLVREAEQKYLAAISMLSRDVKRHRSQLDPIMLARFDAALGDIDRTIKDTRRLVNENPGDPIALQYLLAAYSKKVDALREMTAGSEN
ncbi:MAG TPA: zf-HC2 domain-containing protein [Blastocatellia bacterium]|nr:zf-HC2 domain-containing protein [Blastocatellia bacterium]